MFQKVVLLSNSAIKGSALEQAILSCYLPVFSTITDIVKTAGKTNCAQPIGKSGARHCIDQRFDSVMKEVLDEKNSNVMYVAIENFIDDEKEICDKVAVRLVTNCNRWCMEFINDDDCVVVPKNAACWFVEKKRVEQATLGISQTVGQFLHELDERCPNDDWFEFVDSRNISRKQQIFLSLSNAFSFLKKKSDQRFMVKTYVNFPKDGIFFKDIFPLLKQPTLVTSHAKAILSCRLGENAFSNVFVAGLESRGLLIAAMLATALDVGFVPLRKPGKLAFDDSSPLVGKEYKKEYGTDRIELQPEHLKTFKRFDCILVDDILATGGSIEAAALVLNECGVKIRAILILDDILPLRLTWQNKFANSAVLKEVPIVSIL